MMFTTLLLLLVLLLGVLLLAFVPLHIQVLTLLGLAFLWRWKGRAGDGPQRRQARWLGAGLALAAIGGAYSWLALPTPCPLLTLAKGTTPLILFGLTALVLLRSRERAALSLFGQAFAASLLVLAVLTSALALAWHFGIAKTASAPLEIAAVVTQRGLEWLPGWLHSPIPDTSPLHMALAAWTAFFAGWLVLAVQGKLPDSPWPWARVLTAWGLLFALAVTANLGLFLLGTRHVAGEVPGCAASSSELEAEMQKARRVSRFAQRVGLVDLERRALSRGVKAAQCGVDMAGGLVMAARLATVESYHLQPLLALADLLTRLKLDEQANRLFAESAISDERLAEVEAGNIYEAWTLSELWRERNDIPAVRAALAPYVRIPEEDDREALSVEPYPLWVRVLRRYADYSLHAGDFEGAQQAGLSILAVLPQDVQGLRLVGEVAYEQDDIPTALQHIYHAFRLDNYNSEVVHALIGIYLRLGNSEAAYPLQRRVRIGFPERAWSGAQGSRLFLPGTAYLQGELLHGRNRLEFYARATPAGGEWPIIEVWVNGKKFGQATVDSEEGERYPFEFEARRGANRIEVRYVNDAGSTAEEDRNVRLGPGFIYPIYYETQKER